MVRTRNTRGRTGAQRTRRKTPQTKKPTGWIRGTSGIRTPDGKILTKSDIKSVLLSSKEAVAKRRDITAAEYSRVWQAMPETLLSLIEEAAGGVAKLRKLKQAGGLKLLATAAGTWLESSTARIPRRIGFEDEHAASDEDEDEAGAVTCLVDGNLSGDGLLKAIESEILEVVGLERGDVAARLRALNVRVATSAGVLGLRRQFLLRLVARRGELAPAEPPVTPKRKVTVDMDDVCAMCEADRQPGGYAANGFPVKHRLCERCGLACVGMYSGIGAVSSPFFAGMVDTCVKNAAGFLVERDAFEQAPDENAGGTAGATSAQGAAVAAIIAQLQRTEERAAIAKTLTEGETHDVLKGQRPLDPQHTELRRDAALLRSNELDLRELKDAIGKECTEETRALLEGQFARLAATHAREKHRLEVLAEPGLGLDAVRWSERDARATALTCDTDTPEQAVLRAAEYKKRMDAHAKKRKAPWKAPWRRGRGGGGGRRRRWQRS